MSKYNKGRFENCIPDDCDENLPHICTGIGYTGFQLPNKFGAHSRSEAVDDLYGFTFSLMV